MPSLGKTIPTAGTMLLPLALAQFVASYASSNMNVAINSIATDLNTNVSGIQLTITLFTLTMASLMIPGSKLTDLWGRKFCFMLGLFIYGTGAIIASIAQGLPLLIFGYSLLEGIGSALLIPPIYILITVFFKDITSRAKSFGIVSGMGGVGAAAGPLIGGVITTFISWRASFIFQGLLVVGIIFLGRRIFDSGTIGPKQKFDILGTILSAFGLLFIVIGILQAGTYGWFIAKTDFAIGGVTLVSTGGISPIWIFVGIGAAFLAWFFLHVVNFEKAGKVPLLSTSLFKNKTSSLGLITQNIQWLILIGSSFVISVFLQVVKGHNAIETGLMLTPATIGVLLTSTIAGRLAGRFSQRALIRVGFVATIVGIGLLLFFAGGPSAILAFVPGLFVMGVGIGLMLTPSVNIVQSSFSEKNQGEISGLSRSVSNLGSSLGTAIVGTVLVGAVATGNKAYAYALITVMVISFIGFIASLLLPSHVDASGQQTSG